MPRLRVQPASSSVPTTSSLSLPPAVTTSPINRLARTCCGRRVVPATVSGRRPPHARSSAQLMGVRHRVGVAAVAAAHACPAVRVIRCDTSFGMGTDDAVSAYIYVHAHKATRPPPGSKGSGVSWSHEYPCLTSDLETGTTHKGSGPLPRGTTGCIQYQIYRTDGLGTQMAGPAAVGWVQA